MKPVMKLLLICSFFTCNILSQWVYQQVPANASYYLSIDFPSAQIGAAGGTISNIFRGKGAFTTNSGSNWQESGVPDSCRVMVEISFINNFTGFCAGAYNSVITTGPVDLKTYDKRTLRSLEPTDLLVNYKGLILKTTNSGQNWFPFGILPSNVYYLLGLTFVNPTTGYALAAYSLSGGVNDGVIKTTDAGLTWNVLTMPENINNLNDIYFYDVNTGYAVGYDKVNDTAKGVILKTTNSGASWSRQLILSAFQIQSISFTNSSTGISVGASNEIISPSQTNIYKTTDSGISWSNVLIRSNISINSIDFVKGSGIALAIGSNNLPFPDYKDFTTKTTNFGLNWIDGSFDDAGLTLTNSEFLDQNNMYLTGGDFYETNKPVVLYTTNGAPIGIELQYSDIPLNFSLSQNYPNPFNPVTNIEFSLPKAGYVKLSVYDVMGREVETMVNGYLKPGTYKADWNAVNFTSGVYFYKLISNEFTGTKRMVLVK